MITQRHHLITKEGGQGFKMCTTPFHCKRRGPKSLEVHESYPHDIAQVRNLSVHSILIMCVISSFIYNKWIWLEKRRKYILRYSYVNIIEVPHADILKNLGPNPRYRPVQPSSAIKFLTTFLTDVLFSCPITWQLNKPNGTRRINYFTGKDKRLTDYNVPV